MDHDNTIFDGSSFMQPSALPTTASRDLPLSLFTNSLQLQHLLNPSFVEESRAALLRANLAPLLENRKNAKGDTMSLYGCDGSAGGMAVGVKLEAGSALIDDTLSTSNLNSLIPIPILSPTTASHAGTLSLSSAVVELRDEVETSTSPASKALLPEDSLSHSQNNELSSGLSEDAHSRRLSVSDAPGRSENDFQDATRTETSVRDFRCATGPNEMYKTPLPDTSLIVDFVRSQSPTPSARSSRCGEFQAPRPSLASACEDGNSVMQPSSFAQPLHYRPSYRDTEPEQLTDMEEQRERDRMINKVLADPLRMRMNSMEWKLATPPPLYIKDEGADLGVPSALDDSVRNLPAEDHSASFLSGSDDGSASTFLPTPRNTPSPSWCFPNTLKSPRSLTNLELQGQQCSHPLPSPAPSVPTSPVVATSSTSFTPKRNFIQTSYGSKAPTKRGRHTKLDTSPSMASKSAKVARPSSVRYMPYPNTAFKVERAPKKERVPVPPSTSSAIVVTVEHSVKSEKEVKKAMAVQDEKSTGLPKPKKQKLLPSERAAIKACREPKRPKLLSPLSKLQATKWATTLSWLHFLSENSERVKLDDGQLLLKTLEEIEERREQLDRKLLQAGTPNASLAKLIRKFCHRTRYDDSFGLGIRTKARLISEYIREKFDLQPAPS
ncbi:hypothetical protein BDP27DRAFT_799836 [Rhodocollybia butyracea]|uniref:Uncharacterized protein n=1 Tax=Rhodocollybia butyracea TaxID=206335 RepID=A0A9P5Q894_9AGAR|nr:hypothetical protein BDP27DRAFT_799836 [Rhodocollybia butyracea]